MKYSKSVCILVNPIVVAKVENSYKDIDRHIIATDVLCNGVSLFVMGMHVLTVALKENSGCV